MSATPEALKSDDIGVGDHAAAVARIRSVLLKHGRLGADAQQLAETADLYSAGMTSLASVNVMLGLENEFGIEFPDQMLNRSMFMSISAIEAAVRKVAGE